MGVDAHVSFNQLLTRLKYVDAIVKLYNCSIKERDTHQYGIELVAFQAVRLYKHIFHESTEN